MAELWEVAKLIRSKNAGPWELTIDIMFDDRSVYDAVAASELASAATYASLYHVPEHVVRVYPHPAALAIKITMPRPTPAGAVAETDVFGGQFHSPLVRWVVDVPTVPEAGVQATGAA